MRVAYIGNFGPPHSTESHVAQALRSLGHDLVALQENEVENWRALAAGGPLEDRDLVLWTRTGWDWPSLGISKSEARQLQHAMLVQAAEKSIPTVGYHLDRWWGLGREYEVDAEPFFRSSYVITADGGHNDRWVRSAVNHVWMPPGVSEFECGGGTFRPEMASDVAFVGSWQEGYHTESLRKQLVRYLQRHQADRCRFWPERNQPAVRGEPLRDLYASTKILVGDSCLLPGVHHYWSDRIPETLGRGGFLIHPEVDGLADHFTPGEHLATFPMGDFARLGELIEYYLEHEDERRRIAAAGQAHVLAHHTYTVRMRQVEALLAEKGLVCAKSS